MAERHPVPSLGFAPRGGRSPVRRPAWGRGPAATDDGAVTAEFAIVLPAVVLMLSTLLATATIALNHLRCVDAARAAARAAARNDPASDVVAIARAVGPSDAQVASTLQGGRVVVTVTAPVSLHVPGVPTVWVSSSAVALRELGGEPDPAAGVMAASGLASAGGPLSRRRRRPGTHRPRRPHTPKAERVDAVSDRARGGRERGGGERAGRDRGGGEGSGRDHGGGEGAGRERDGGERAGRDRGGGERGGRGRGGRERGDAERGVRERGVRDRGAGTVLALGLIGVVIGLTAGLGTLGQVVASRHRAAAAADLAALAAAQTVAGTGAESAGAGPCAVAARVAAANGGRLAACSLGPDGTATVSVRVEAGHGRAAQATARGGPAASHLRPHAAVRRR